jgi:hypothetical protein
MRSSVLPGLLGEALGRAACGARRAAQNWRAWMAARSRIARASVNCWSSASAAARCSRLGSGWPGCGGILERGWFRSFRRSDVYRETVAWGQQQARVVRGRDVPAEHPVKYPLSLCIGVRGAGLVKSVGAEQVMQLVAVRPTCLDQERAEKDVQCSSGYPGGYACGGSGQADIRSLVDSQGPEYPRCVVRQVSV